MRVFDTSLLMRPTIGFDNVSRILDTVARVSPLESSYPPYDIEKAGDDHYRISMAVAGFSDADLDITVRENILAVSGKILKTGAEIDNTKRTVYLHRSIARRAFERQFQLADTIKVTGAELENGLLHVELVREVLEENKPRQIEIKTSATSKKEIEKQAA